jgi:hypothetical protein
MIPVFTEFRFPNYIIPISSSWYLVNIAFHIEPLPLFPYIKLPYKASFLTPSILITSPLNRYKKVQDITKRERERDEGKERT